MALPFPLYVAATEVQAQSVPHDSIMHYFDVVDRRMMAGDAALDAATRARKSMHRFATHVMPHFH